MSIYEGTRLMLEEIKKDYDAKFDLISRILSPIPELTVWGTVPCWWHESTKTIILCGGEAGETDDAPWKTHSDVNVITVAYPVTLQDGADLFSDLDQLTNINGADLLDTQIVTDMWRCFAGCTALKSIDVNTWDVSKVGRFNDMFWKCGSLEVLDLSGWQTTEGSNYSRFLNGCASIKKLDMSEFDTTAASNLNDIFTDTDQLTELTLGDKSIFTANSDLPENNTDGYTGRWIGQTTGVVYETSADFMDKYDGTNPDTFVREVTQ